MWQYLIVTRVLLIYLPQFCIVGYWQWIVAKPVSSWLRGVNEAGNRAVLPLFYRTSVSWYLVILSSQQRCRLCVIFCVLLSLLLRDATG
jgi:hypothetical protein